MTGHTALTRQSMNAPYGDAERYETARSIDEGNPDWLVIWGVYTRQYVAFPLFRAPAGSIVQSASPDRLLRRMRQAELAFTSDHASRGPGTDPFQAARHHDAAGWQGGDSPNP